MSAFEEILNTINKHERDGFEVEAVRVPSNLFKELVQSPSYKAVPEGDACLSHEESVGLVAGKEIIVDEEISEPVANDVKLVNYDEF